MRILIAPNALRGSLDAAEAAEAIGLGVRRAMPHAQIRAIPIADGGDGTASVVVRACGGALVETETQDPLGRSIQARWGLLNDDTAVIDVAAASGLSHLEPTERDPFLTSTFGTGHLLRAALDRGCRRLVIGLGGSATVDGGAGLLEALGAKFLTKEGESIHRGGKGLLELDRVDLTGLHPRVLDASILVACDVDSPLLGPDGAAPVFGPQKGASPEMVVELARGLERLAEAIERQNGRDVRKLRHGGAAGGLGAALHGWLGASLVRGIDWVLDRTGFLEAVSHCDLVITSEGMLDDQTLAHKGPYGVAQAAKARGVPVIVLAGAIADTVSMARFDAFDAMLPACRRPVPVADAMKRSRGWLEAAAEQATRLLLLGAHIDSLSADRDRAPW